MTNKDQWREILQAQLACLDEISEDDIGTEVYVRDCTNAAWEGPYVLDTISSPEDMAHIFDVVQSAHSTMTYRFATKIPPIEPQHLTLIPWHGGECPVKDGTQTALSFKSGNATIIDDPEEWAWGFGTTITGYAPVIITIDIEEE